MKYISVKSTSGKLATMIFCLCCLSFLAGAQIQISVTNGTCNKNDGSASVTGVTHAQAPLSYQWSNGSTGASINNVPPGYYSVTVTDARGCKGVAGARVKATKGLNVDLGSGGSVPYCIQDGPPTITITANASGGTPPYYYSPAQSITVSGSGKYSIGVMDENGCFGRGSAVFTFIPIRCSRDPNEIIGPDGYGPEKFVTSLKPISYQISFENDPDFATAPAQRVTVTHEFDPHMNMYSMKLGDFGFANLLFNVPANTSSYNTRIDARDSLGVYIDVTAGINVGNHSAFWIFQTIDPATGVPPEDPMLGFLPINDSTHRGEGFVTFNVKPKTTTVTGDTISAKAIIVFDINPPIETNTWTNTADAGLPSSHVITLAASYDTTTLIIGVSSTDDAGGSGIARNELYYSEDGGAFQKFEELPPDSSFYFTGSPCTEYRFFSIATDNAGNVEPMKENPDASTVIMPLPQFTNQPPDTTVNESEDITLTVEVSGADFFEWEASADGGITFMLLADQPPFSGGNTPSLTITNAPTYISGFIFRCKAGNGSCFQFSREITLLVVSGLSGRVYYDNTQQSPMTNTKVLLRDLTGLAVDSAMTNLTGNYVFKDLNPGIYQLSAQITKPWLSANATDALLIIRYFAGLEVLTPIRKHAADVNLSHTINAVDALLVARRFVELIYSFYAGDWYSETDTVQISDSSIYRDIPAICIGDVDGSDVPGLKKGPGIKIIPEGSLTIREGDEILIPLKVRKGITAGAISLVLEYPEHNYSVEEVLLKNQAYSDNLVYNTRDGVLRVAWFNNNGLNIEQGEALIILKIKAIENPLIGSLELRVGDGCEISDINGTVFNQVEVTFPKLSGLQTSPGQMLGQNYPNPFFDQTRISYYLEEAGNVQIKVYNPFGQEIATLVDKNQDKGYYSVDFGEAGIAAGNYSLRLEFRGENMTKSAYIIMTKSQ